MMYWMFPIVTKAVYCFALVVLAGCTNAPPNNSIMKNTLAKMKTAEVTIGGKHRYKVWLALSGAEQQTGLMNTTLDELPPDRGMLFVFDHDNYQSFWMRNTVIPLDIAYIRSDGTIVKTYTMKALDESGYPSFEPARFALEVRAGQFEEKGIRSGDRVEIPSGVFNPRP